MKKQWRNLLGVVLALMMMVSCTVLPSFAANTATSVVAPNNVRPTRMVANNVTIKWDAVVGATGYTVYRSTNKNGAYTPVGNVAGTSYTDVTARGRTSYYYKVQAKSLLDFLGGAGTSSPTRVIVSPKNPRVVVMGECFAVGVKLFGQGILPNGYTTVATGGLTSYGAVHSACIKQQNGTKVTPMAAANAYNPDRVYLMIGVNEAKGREPDFTINNFKDLHKRMRAKNPNLVLVVCSLPPRGKTYDHSLALATNEKTRRYNQAYKNYANANDDVFYFDYTNLVTDREGNLSAEANGGDGCHMNKPTYQKITRALVNYDQKTFQ